MSLVIMVNVVPPATNFNHFVSVFLENDKTVKICIWESTDERADIEWAWIYKLKTLPGLE
jgi:hypothetical protein